MMSRAESSAIPLTDEQWSAAHHLFLHHQLRGMFGHPGHRASPFPDPLSSARRAGLLAPAEHKVSGDASISVDFRNMPRGVAPSAKASD